MARSARIFFSLYFWDQIFLDQKYKNKNPQKIRPPLAVWMNGPKNKTRGLILGGGGLVCSWAPELAFGSIYPKSHAGKLCLRLVVCCGYGQCVADQDTAVQIPGLPMMCAWSQ